VDRDLDLVSLRAAEHEPTYGGKAVSLGAALRAGLPVPDGIALSASFVERLATGDAEAIAHLEAQGASALAASRLAVRSSAAGEDSAGASFAGQHVTKLNVRHHELRAAVHAVWESAYSDAARLYRQHRGLPPTPRIGAVVQALIEPLAAGVMFTRDPMTGADEYVIEASWGLGEIVVSGMVTPDRYRLDRSGILVEATPGHKDMKLGYGEAGGTFEVRVPDDLHAALCLRTPHLQALVALAQQCHRIWGDALDIEWAVGQDNGIHLLQCRPITAAGLPA
jgi:pyruvate, water dikinase